jgi:hypothetical protein
MWGEENSFFFYSYVHTMLGRGCREKGTLIHCWWECKLEQPLWKTVWRLLKKLNIEQSSSNTTPRDIPEGL